MVRTRFDERRRPRSVWIALGSGIVGAAVVALVVLLPVLTLVTTSLGADWFVDIPLGRIGVVVAAGCLLAAGLLALILRTRRGALAWVLAVAAVVAVLVVSLYPLGAVAAAATGRVGEIIPFVTRWIQFGADLLP
jgi:hypothetical protein